MVRIISIERLRKQWFEKDMLGNARTLDSQIVQWNEAHDVEEMSEEVKQTTVDSAKGAYGFVSC